MSGKRGPRASGPNRWGRHSCLPEVQGRHECLPHRLAFWPLALILVGLLLIPGTLAAQDQRATTVGMPARMEQIVLPGPELEVKPLGDRKTPIVLRIASVAPHGTAFRYDLEYYGLDPGTFDLRDFLKRKDGSSTANLPPLRVTIQPILPPGHVLPNALEAKPSPWLGGYRLLLIVAGAIWIVGLLLILFWRRWRRADGAAAAARPLTLADRLRPLIEKAMKGRLATSERADLERMLLAYWRRRLQLDGLKPHEAFAVLRKHAEAGPLLERLESWLHKPVPPEKVDLDDLLQPYRNLPAEAGDDRQIARVGSP